MSNSPTKLQQALAAGTCIGLFAMLVGFVVHSQATTLVAALATIVSAAWLLVACLRHDG